MIHVVSCHAAGEVGDVIVGGVPTPPGSAVCEQARFIAADGNLRNFVLNEPRGGVFRHVNLLLPSTTAAADFGWIIMEPEDTPPMSGSNAMCVTTVILETGLFPMTEPESHLTLEAPGGLVKVTANCRDGRVERVTVRNVPSFVDTLNGIVEVLGIGSVVVDLAYGGDSFALVDGRRLGLSVTRDEAQDLAEIGARVTKAVNEQLPFDKAQRSGLSKVSFARSPGRYPVRRVHSRV